MQIRKLLYNLGNWRTFLFYAFLILVGMVFGWYFERSYLSQRLEDVVKNRQLRLGQESTYPFVNPLIACDISDQDLFPELKLLKGKIDQFINSAREQNKISRTSLYFRDINRGQWVGINENDTYIPASLVKLPLMISYYKLAEQNPGVLNRVVTFESRYSDNERQVIAPPPDKLLPSHPYPIRELLERMISYSDNDAYRILGAIIDPRARQAVYSDLGFDYVPTGPNVNSTSVKSFSLFLRILYNASYLNRKSSNAILEQLTQTTFKEGLVAGLPDSVTVAHKFGERTVDNNGEPLYRELHDCGIVYHPTRPYLLCIMTQGNDFESLKKVIRDLSSLIYSEVSNNL